MAGLAVAAVLVMGGLAAVAIAQGTGPSDASANAQGSTPRPEPERLKQHGSSAHAPPGR